MNNYTENKKRLDALRRQDEVMFRMAISHLVDVGFRHLTEENIADCCNEIMQEDDSCAFMSNDYKCRLIKLAGEIAKIDHIHVLTYISREVYYDVGDGEINYSRAIQIVKNCLNYCEWSTYETMYALETARNMGFNDDEIEQLGYGYMLDIEREE